MGSTTAVLSRAAMFTAIAFASPSYAQTAEDTVAFLLYGLEDGVPRTYVERGSLTSISVTKLPGTKTIYLLKSNKEPTFSAEYSLETVLDCKYRVHVKNMDGQNELSEDEVLVDLGSLSDGEFWKHGSHDMIRYKALSCQQVQAPRGEMSQCERLAEFNEAHMPEARWRKALQYFRTNFCRSQKAF